MATARGWLSGISTWAASNAAFSVLQGWAGPAAVSAATAIAGWVGAYPIFYIIPATAFAFAMTATAILRFDQLRERTSAVNKLSTATPIVGKAVSANDPNLFAIKLGITAVSRANFPLEVSLDSLVTQIADRVPSAKFEPRKLLLDPSSGVAFTNDAIDLTNVERANKTLYGNIEAVLTYGRPGRRAEKQEYSVALALRFDEAGELQFAEPSVTGFKPPF